MPKLKEAPPLALDALGKPIDTTAVYSSLTSFTCDFTIVGEGRRLSGDNPIVARFSELFIDEREPDDVIGAAKFARAQAQTLRIKKLREAEQLGLQADLAAAARKESALQKFFAERREYKRKRKERMERSGKLTEADTLALKRAGRPIPKV